MRIAFVRHGERRKGESDPELTSFGYRMVEETSQWLISSGFSPDLALTTSTMRTQQTTQTILAHFPSTRCERLQSAPELHQEWELFTASLGERSPKPASVLLVAHHPTMEMLIQCCGPAPAVVTRHQFAVGLILEATSSSGWTISHAWPGRTS